MTEIPECISDLLRELERQVNNPWQREVVLDLTECNVFSSHFVNELIRTNLRLRMSERRLLLVNVPPTVCETLKLLRLDRTFDFQSAPVCIENGQASPAIKQRFDTAEKTVTLFLRKFASRFALRSAQ